MAFLDPPGGAGRQTLINALAKLRQQYAGPRGAVPPDQWQNAFADDGWRGVADDGTRQAVPPSPGAYVPGGLVSALGPGVRLTDTGQTQSAPGAWDPMDPSNWRQTATGGFINAYNPYLGGPDTWAAPGPVGRGPGTWIDDSFGHQWRSDWDHYDAAQGKWLIKGEN